MGTLVWGRYVDSSKKQLWLWQSCIY